MDLTPLIKPESSTWWSFPTLDNSSDQFPIVRWSDLENIFENTLTFCHNFLDVVDPILSFLFLSAWLFKFLFLEVCGKAGPSICELIKSLCEGGGRLFTGLRGRGVRKVLEILNWKAWNFGNYWGSEDNISIRKFFASLACIYPSASLQAMKIGVHNLR